MTIPDYIRLPAHEIGARKCIECERGATYATTDGPQRLLRCLNCTARWAKGCGLLFPKLCAVKVDG